MARTWSDRSWGVRRAAVGLVVGALVASSAVVVDVVRVGARPGPTVGAQLGAIRAEKGARSRAERKVDSQLVYAANEEVAGVAVAGAPGLRSTVEVRADDTTVVDITGTVAAPLLAAIEATGGSVLDAVPAFGAVQARVPIDAVTALAARADVRSISPPAPIGTQQAAPAPAAGGRLRAPAAGDLAGIGSVANEADVVQLVAQARADYGVDGTGVKVCVISDGITGLASSQADGDVPSIVDVLPGQAGFGGEGVAMLELIHDLVPGATLGFATAGGSFARYAQNIVDLQASGCQIIVDDMYSPLEDPLRVGVLDRAISAVRAAGATYFSSIGNSGNVAAGTSDTWQGDFTSSTATDPAPLAGADLLDFGGTNGNRLERRSGSSVLAWADPLHHAATDLDLYLLSDDGTEVVMASTNVQDGVGGDDEPYEQFLQDLPDDHLLVVERVSGPPVFLRLQADRGRLAEQTGGSVTAHAASTDAIGVAAAPAAAPYPFPAPDQGLLGPAGPHPAPFTATQEPEPFTGAGPAHRFYDADDDPITPGNLLAETGGGTTTLGPTITAADGVATGAPGFERFYGTSAAAPNAAAIAALALSAVPAASPDQLEAALVAGALDLGPPGADVTTGAGIVLAPAVLQALGATPLESPPVAVDDAVVAVSGAPRSLAAPGLLANDTDADGDALTAARASDPSHGTVTVAADGSFTYTAIDGYRGPDAFTYTASDGVEASPVATVSVTVATPSDAFVRQVYADLLHRSPSGPELASWAGRLDGGASRGSFTRAVLASHERRVAEVRAAYQRTLGRAPDPAGSEHWARRLGGGLTDRSFEAHLAGSSELLGQHGGTAAGFVDAAYPLLLGRPADPSGRAHWIRRLAGGTTRTGVAASLLASAEGRRTLATRLHQHLLDRAPSADELAAAVTGLAPGRPDAVIVAITATTAYLDRAIVAATTGG